MQSDSKEIYRLTAERTGLNEQLYADIGNFVQKDIHEQMKKPKSLILKVKGIGFWYLSKKRLSDILSYFPLHYDIEGYNDFPSEQTFLRFVNKQELYKILKARLRDYDEYLRVKAEIKKLKDEFKENERSKKESNSSSESNT
jgi:hypothetical protein